MNAFEEARKRWDGVAKPLDGLGVFEDMITGIAALTGDPNVDISKRAVVVMCADNGVVSEGVTQTDAGVTGIMAEKIALGESSVCVMAREAGCDVFAVDIGMNEKRSAVRDLSIRRGTGNIAREAAMSRDEAVRAIDTGKELAGELKGKGYRLIMTGEMGIGNTTVSAALASILLSVDPGITVGRGAGLSDKGLERKKEVVRCAVNAFIKGGFDPNDPIELLSRLGGLDVAGMAGLFLGGHEYRVPVVIDGFISSVAALIAYLIDRSCKDAMIASHVSDEPAAGMVIDRLGLRAPINAGMKLGEGTGAVMMGPLLDMALSVYNSSLTFSKASVGKYEHYGDKP